MDTLTRKPEMKKEINILVKICVSARTHRLSVFSEPRNWGKFFIFCTSIFI